MCFVNIREKTHIVSEKIVRKAMKRSLSNFWHPHEVFESLNKGAFVDGQLCSKAAGNNVLNGALRAGFSHPARSLQSRRCYLWAQRLDKTPSEQEYLCAWNLRSSTPGAQLYPSQPRGLLRRGEMPPGGVQSWGRPGPRAAPPGVRDRRKLGHRKP